ncbi:hypothetical protein PISMIDRAFT_671449 [Pisolithus microcarpus 441]|uniref:non-specific serine/threonine protein kinase n=1 Tax=Pisolithus microcarpus 441 TaxID=765257 RepID=A0A0C9YYQ1_9AGAM|nr:hypothetical protein PISMIDRAFT_671449 [Pisolithus microcarpus 441]
MSLHQNQGTLAPGQTISVNKYTVQVEKYLSQGGFSHVYLVKTPAPIYNTTHHVLKRIAVANETMLAEVKKEVDIMRILKGHPNVVYLIDAAWHRMSNGQYEVFILMEFCQGGGIIDMMNRRLRKRLTEAEILQIFVDVCEGVAAMHNLRPPLLHRDLKVENILQSSSTTFKLCDFGSATPVALKPPATTQEIRILEADLNRHTTLQYRAPEMIDPYLRRPVDEKSDVWALGVLLYKLCYYTTPFEEHGPLAILNVQYRIPPYPVYSPQLNALIASMLREHGTQRPSVFELLEQLHLMRGTKPKFVYHIPPPQPLSPRVLQAHPTTPRDHSAASIRPRSSNAQYKQRDVIPGVQVREKVLGNVTPRRGRPNHQKESLLPSTSRPASPTAASPSTPLKVVKRDWLADDEDKAWRALKSGTPSTGDTRPQGSGDAGWSAWKPKSVPSNGLTGEPSIPKHTGPGARALTTFGDNFTERPRYDSAVTGSAVDAPMASKVKSTPSTLASHLEGSRSTRLVIPKSKDAFDGLGLPAPTLQPPTLGQARKLRTGLAAVGDYNHRVSVAPNPSAVPMIPSSPVSRPSASPRPPLPRTSSSRRSSPSVQLTPLISAGLSGSFQPNNTPVEARFPPLEQLDSALASVNPSRLGSLAELSVRENKIDLSEPPSLSRLLQPQRLAPSYPSQPSAHSQEISAGKVRDTKVNQSRSHAALDGVIDANPHPRPSRLGPSPSPSPEKHTASVPTQTGQSSGLLDTVGTSAPTLTEVQNGQEPRDWLTGDVDSQLSAVKGLQLPSTSTPETPVLREFTKKRSSFIEENNVHIPSPQEGITGQQTLPKSPTLQLPTKMLPYPRPEGCHPVGRTLVPEGKKGSTLEAIRLSSERVVDSWQYPFPESAHEAKSSSDEEGPEEAVGVIPGRPTEKGLERKRRGRQSSVHDLVDLWGGGVVQTRERVKDVTQDSVVRDPSNDLAMYPPRTRPVIAPSATKPGTPQLLQVRSSDGGTVDAPRPPSRTSGRRSPVSRAKRMSSSVSITSPTPVSSNTRPQSLLLFPVSKSVSDGKLETPSTPTGLSVPQDGFRKNGTRRTSISDMVQRFEAINANVKTTGHGPPSTLPKPSGLKISPAVPSSSTGTRPAQTTVHSPSVSRFHSSRASEHSSPNKDADKGPSLSSSAVPCSSEPLTALPSSSSSTFLSSPSERPGPVDGLPPVHSVVPSEEHRRSPSPEKPYQGVGRLIDQWQRKSEEAESARGPLPRKGYIPKRAGLV